MTADDRTGRVLLLPIKLLSKNGRDKLHWHRRAELRNEYKAIIEIMHPRKHETPDYKQHVAVTRLMGKGEREFDTQNIAGGSAGVELLDAFKHLGWWRDDSSKWLEPHFAQVRDKRGPAVLIEIERVLV